nr:immunoglobulin light chain junction region [Macaca mulatta]
DYYCAIWYSSASAFF